MIYLYFVATALFFLLVHPAKAVPPPDFIFNVTSQIAQFFSISVILFSAAGSVLYRFFQTRFAGRQKLVYWIIGSGVAIILSGGGAWLYGQYAKQQEMKQWLAESKLQNQIQAEAQNQQTSSTSPDQEPTGVVEQAQTDTLDQLPIGTTDTLGTTAETTDAVSNFIRSYYQAIADHQFEKAYDMSKKSVSLETFKSWYTHTDKISIDRLQRIDEKRSSLQLTLIEGEETTRYGVLMNLRLDANGQPVQVEQSTVRTLSLNDVSTSTQQTEVKPVPITDSLSISNEAFKQIVSGSKDSYYVLDARENIEFQNGHFPDANHIRFADLKSGRWIELPTDKPVFVFCWSGIRGKEVTEFLRTKYIRAQYLEQGANGWVSFGGTWDGEIAFLKIYTNDRYKKVFSVDETTKQSSEGVILVDSRPPLAYQAWHIPGSINIPLMYTPTISIESAFAQVPAHSTIITVCDGYVNCFDAKLTGVELERRGHTFLGRFAEPWKLK